MCQLCTETNLGNSTLSVGHTINLKSDISFDPATKKQMAIFSCESIDEDLTMTKISRISSGCGSLLNEQSFGQKGSTLKFEKEDSSEWIMEKDLGFTDSPSLEYFHPSDLNFGTTADFPFGY